MTPRPRTLHPWEGSLRLLRWVLLQLLPAWLCVGLSFSSSAAAAADEDAPMCDPHGASVAAPTEVPEVDRGKLEEMPCDALLRWLGSGIELGDSDSSAAAGDAMPPQSPELQLYRSCLDGVLEIVVARPERAAPRDLPALACAGLPPRPGHTSPVYRPPLAA
ncbi:MAG: hypothetical protein ABI895_42960 [Deltaproteobacteria bacterium]